MITQEILILLIQIALKYGPAAYEAAVELFRKKEVTIDDLVALKGSFVHYADL